MTAGARRSALGTRCAAVRRALARAARVARAVIGAPDYERYLEHHRANHPGEALLSAQQFAREREGARYERPGARCC